TPGADVGPARNPVHENADALEVRVEPPLRGHHGVAPVVSERGSFPADCADLRHRTASIASAYSVDAARSRVSRSAISSAESAGLEPLFPCGPPARSSACRRLSQVRRPKATGT